ncbi:MAG TPA: low molecular weight protein-tyrosine-phosphatase [Cytophagaceae bacterium]|nr:low molecular weight protein-tyrosine-phosphatase [Cytophagaceae bacterium]
MYKILFVCLGNICRSPLAEGVFKQYVSQKGLENNILCDSAGTAGYHIGSCPDTRSIQIARLYGIELDHFGRKLEPEDFNQFDVILAMDENNYKDILSLQKKSDGDAKVFMFRDFDPAGKGNVPDPYYGSMKDFDEVYQMCARTSENLLKYLLTLKH